MNIESWSVTGASLCAVIAAAYEVAVRGGRHTRRIMHAVEQIESHSIELLPNHGSSLRDQVDRIAAEQDRQRAIQADHTAVLADVQRTLSHVAVVVAEQATRDPAAAPRADT